MGRRKAKPPPGYAKRLRDVLATPLGHILVRAAGAALLVLLGGLVMRQARAEAYRMPAYRLTPESIRFVSLPDWADADVRKELVDGRYYRAFSSSIFDSDAEADIRAVVTGHPLVQSVRRISVSYPRQARVEPILRRPVATALVRVPGRAGRATRVKRLLGDDGSLLPIRPYAGYVKRLRQPLPTVQGIQALGPTRIGVIWEERHGQVAEAVAAADVARRLFRDTRGRVHVSVIDVGRFPARRDELAHGEVAFEIVVHPIRRGERAHRVRLEWGRTERDCRDVPREDCYHTKLHRLERALSATGPLPHALDVRFPDQEG